MMLRTTAAVRRDIAATIPSKFGFLKAMEPKIRNNILL
jgi:hypothetical protein